MRGPKEFFLIVFISFTIFFIGYLFFTYPSGISVKFDFLSGGATNTEFTEPSQNSATETSPIEKTPVETGGVINEVGPFPNLSRGDRTTALKNSSGIKGVYMTQYVGNSPNSSIFKDIEKLLAETELNAVVIDVKESEGPALYSSLRGVIEKFHSNNIWVVARICAFRDSSQKNANPDWYVKKYATTTESTTTEFWKDNGGGFWLDPENQQVQEYLVDFSKKVIDFGFDELQFDYVRFPTDGDLSNIVYPNYDPAKYKYETIGGFFRKLSVGLRDYSSSTILSIDLFGDVAVNYHMPEIGQRIADVADMFDYISFMLYPSHYYNGFQIGQDLKRNLPALYFPYEATNTSLVVSNHPYEVVSRSVFTASDYLANLGSKTKIRPWLQSFDLGFDTKRGIFYDAQKIRSQIDGAENSSALGWLLWSPRNVYNENALLKTP